MKNLFIPVAILVLFAGCRISSDTSVDLATKELFGKFPELGEDTSYVFVRKVYNGSRDFIAQREDKIASIPLLTNDYQAFWSFDRASREKKNPLTFTDELYACIRKLGLDDTLIGPRQFINELFISVLHYEWWQPDSTYTENIGMPCGEPLPGDCGERAKNDLKEIDRVLNKFKTTGYNGAFFDERTNRIFLLEYQSDKVRSRLSEIDLKVLLHECPARCLFM
jgi:hypothetical protein